MTPIKGSRSGASDSEALSVPIEENHSEDTRVDGNMTLTPKPSRYLKKKADKTVEEPQDQQRYWNEYDNPEDGDENPDGEFYVYIDPDAPLYPGQRSLENFGRKFKSAFKRPFVKKDLEHGVSATGDDASISSSEDDDETTTSSTIERANKAVHKPLITRSTQTQTKIGYGTLSMTTIVHTVDTQRARTTALCLLAAAIILAILNVLANTGRRKTLVEVHVVVLLGVVASIAFLGTAVGIWLRGLTESRSKRSMYAHAVVGLVAVLIGAGDAWLLVSVLT